MRRVHTAYNQLAGKNVERLAALSDGIFAVAMTLLVLELHIPGAMTIFTERDFLEAMKALSPRLVIYLMSFLTLGIFWVGQQTQLNHIERGDHHYVWLNLAFLSLVTLIPFSTSLLATFISYRSALLIYWLNILALGITVVGAWLYAQKSHLTKPEAAKIVHRAFLIRVCVAQGLYACAALLCFVFNTRVSIGLIVLIQLNYALAPKLLFRSKGGSQDSGASMRPRASPNSKDGWNHP